MPLRAKAMNRALIPQDTSGTVSWPDHPERNDGRELLSLSMDARIPIRKEQIVERSEIIVEVTHTDVRRTAAIIFQYLGFGHPGQD